MPSIASRAGTAFLDLFRPRAPVVPPDLEHRPELTAADFMANREMYPVFPLAGWTPGRIINMLNAHDTGVFVESELFYHALRKEGLISAALAMRREADLEYASTLQCPKEAPKEMHELVAQLARNWQTVLPDAVRGECIERMNVFGFAVCRIQWTWEGGQRQPLFHPWTHSSLQYREDLSSPDKPIYQGISRDGDGIEFISNDGREWVVFSLGGTRPWLGGMIRALAFVYFGIITGDDRWLNFNDKFAEPIRLQYTPRLTREQPEAQRLYGKVQHMRGGDLSIQPREGKDMGYDFRYEQVDAQGYETLKEQLERFDMRAAIIILGHNLLQQVKGGSLAAMKEAKGLLRTKSITDLRNCTTACEPLSKVWARANFGNNELDRQAWSSRYPDLNGKLPEQVTWSLAYDTTDPEVKELAAARAQKFADAFEKFFKGLTEAIAAAGGGAVEAGGEPVGSELAAGPIGARPAVAPPAPKPAPNFVKRLFANIDWIETAERCGLPMKGGEDSYSQDDDEEAELSAVRVRMVPARKLGLLTGAAQPDLGPGVMVALIPRPDEAAAMAMGGGEAPAQLHATLGYLGRLGELPPKFLETLHQQAAAAAQQVAPLAGVLGGLGRFSSSDSSDGRDVIYATPNVVGMVELRQKLAAMCASAGVPFRANHGWTPHMTLAYVEPGAPMPQRLEPRPVHFDAIWVCLGTSRWEFPLTGATVEVLSAVPQPETAGAPALTLLASGDSPDSAVGLIEGQQAVDALADEPREAPGLAAVLAALDAAADWADLRERLAGIVRDLDIRDSIAQLEDLAHQADHIGAESVDHDLPAGGRAEVDAAERARKPGAAAADLRAAQQRAGILAKAATAYVLYSVARHLWDAADRAAALGYPLDAHRADLAASLLPWSAAGALWETARAEPLQHAFTHGRIRRLQDATVRAIAPYWRFDAVLDGRTTPLCRRLNGYTRPAGDPAMPIPPLHWRCRSTVRAIGRAEGELAVSVPVGVAPGPGFAPGAYPRPDSGPDSLLAAYRDRMGI